MALLKELLTRSQVIEASATEPYAPELVELNDIYEELLELQDRTRQALRKLPRDQRDRAEREWFAEWRALMNDEHPYVNRKGWTFMDTLDDLADNAPGLADWPEDEDK